MVIPENRDGKLENDPDLARESSDNAPVNTRKGGVQKQSSKTSRVIVDMREFRSDLPFLVHKLNIDLVPATLEVGDYILTPDICVERKSVSDLIGSLNNGRLYTQCVSMTRYYKRPVLLIEFDPTKAFTLQKNFNVSKEISINDIQSRLALLTLHFPKLRILWCQSAHGTAKLFRDLKTDADEPDLETALTVTSDISNDRDIKYNPGPYDLLMKVPNISIKNIRLVLDKVKSLEELSSLSQEDLSKLLDNKQYAEAIVDFLNKDYNPDLKENTKVNPAKKTHGAQQKYPPGTKKLRL